MKHAELREKVIGIVMNELGVEKHECVDNAGLIEDLGADELDLMEIIMNLEIEFDIDIEDGKFDIYTEHTIDETVLLVSNKTGHGA